jgi:hypothetical protein
VKRRRRRERPDIAADAELGLAWYTREGWERLRELAVDREQLDDSFDAWERGAQAAIAELAAMGRVVRKVPIDLEALLAWCQTQDRPLDSAARAEYVTHLLLQRH